MLKAAHRQDYGGTNARTRVCELDLIIILLILLYISRIF